MKDILRLLGIVALIVLAVIIVAGSRGNDELDFNLNKKEQEEYENENFYYNIEKAQENGQYKNMDKSNTYAMLGKNSDGTYRLYFIKAVGMNKLVILREDSLEIRSDGSGTFRNNSNKVLTINLYSKSFTIQAPPQTTGDSEIEGSYQMMHSISSFSASEFKFK